MPSKITSTSSTTSKFSFVVLSDYINQTITDLYTYGLIINKNETDFSLGYFTIEGENESIKNFYNFLNGEYQ